MLDPDNWASSYVDKIYTEPWKGDPVVWVI